MAVQRVGPHTAGGHNNLESLPALLKGFAMRLAGNNCRPIGCQTMLGRPGQGGSSEHGR